MKSEDIPPLPALDDFCFAPDIDLGLAVSVGDNHNTVSIVSSSSHLPPSNLPMIPSNMYRSTLSVLLIYEG